MQANTATRTITARCPEHNIDVTAERGERIVCSAGPHALAQSFPSEEFWEYCCDCQRFWPSDHSLHNRGNSQCPVCERLTVRRFLCAQCNVISVESDSPGPRKAFSIPSSRGIPVPACPGCLKDVETPGVEHDCEDFGAPFITLRSVCPFCEHAIESPPSFPCSVAKYLDKLRAPIVTLKFDLVSNALRQSESGEFVLIEKARGSALPIIVPKAAKFVTKQDYYTYYQTFFNCDNPSSGDVVIRSPAIVEKMDGGWRLRETGFIEIEPDRSVKVRPPATHAMVKCDACGSAGAPDDSFCKVCGTPLIPNFNPQPQVERSRRVGASHSQSSADTNTVSYPIVPQTANSGTVASAPVTTQTSSGLKAIVGVVIGVAVLGIVITIIATVSISGNSVQRRLDGAIARGNLFGPGTENAHDLYNALKAGGATDDTLKGYREKLTPRLTSRGYQMTTDLMQIGYDEPDAPEWQEAARNLDWAVELNPGNTQITSRAAYCEGRAAYLQKRYDQALTSWTRAADLDKSWVLPANGIGMVYLARKDYPTARSYYEKATQRDQNWPIPYENIGNTYWEQKDYLTAAQFYRRALEKDPHWAKPHYHLADIAWNSRDYATVVSEYDAALDPNSKGLKPNETAVAQKRREVARQHLSSP